MSTPFLAEIKIVSFNFAPKGWAQCNGQFLPIAQNQALFSLLGTTYGGNGQTTFALPDLRGRLPMHIGNGHTQGERGGEEAHSLSVDELPSHNHLFPVSTNPGNRSSSAGNYPAAAAGHYGPSSALIGMQGNTVWAVGGSQAHENRPPFLALNFVMALQGIFPSQN